MESYMRDPVYLQQVPLENLGRRRVEPSKLPIC